MTVTVRWQDGEMWLGYIEQFQDYLTQGETLAQPSLGGTGQEACPT